MKNRCVMCVDLKDVLDRHSPESLLWQGKSQRLHFVHPRAGLTINSGVPAGLTGTLMRKERRWKFQHDSGVLFATVHLYTSTMAMKPP
jgi:hypothetical protein